MLSVKLSIAKLSALSKLGIYEATEVLEKYYSFNDKAVSKLTNIHSFSLYLNAHPYDYRKCTLIVNDLCDLKEDITFNNYFSSRICDKIDELIEYHKTYADAKSLTYDYVKVRDFVNTLSDQLRRLPL